ncbi:hypothetical protein PanWU01x14_192750 [Parasponia andersonii]|uniref:Uncharacterized protein n=1 Tax=Parasponia andersonii TaxID=3476 RepID=A0A2P5C180_PARAD|nr:hypothetical protein PanWU01x14_192750 [Parasponia andersonii]
MVAKWAKRIERFFYKRLAVTGKLEGLQMACNDIGVMVTLGESNALINVVHYVNVFFDGLHPRFISVPINR